MAEEQHVILRDIATREVVWRGTLNRNLRGNEMIPDAIDRAIAGSNGKIISVTLPINQWVKNYKPHFNDTSYDARLEGHVLDANIKMQQ